MACRFARVLMRNAGILPTLRNNSARRAPFGDLALNPRRNIGRIEGAALLSAKRHDGAESSSERARQKHERAAISTPKRGKNPQQ